MSELVLVLHTTRYREGGASFARIAATLAAERSEALGLEAQVVAVESKAAFREALASAPGRLRELHFVGHSGMYGPMLGTTRWPEQFSPHEWRTLRIPFAEGAEAHFHACRTARWFAPFFARTQGVPTHGYHGYTSFSRRPDRFVPPLRDDGSPLYAMAIDGRKSHGWLGSLRKYGGLARPEPLRRFLPSEIGDAASYDAVADAYDATFDDVRVRVDEWRFLDARIHRGARVLDLGCGNGALLEALAPRLDASAGVDASPAMLARARRRLAPHAHLRLAAIDGPRLPFPDASFDAVVSLLSFRYLDWDPMLDEILRVTRPDGRLLIVDMVASPATLRDLPRLVAGKLHRELVLRARPRFRTALDAMVRMPAWQAMVEHNPIRAEHEYRWYLGSRFPEGRIEVINVGGTSKVLAFESGPLERALRTPMSFP